MNVSLADNDFEVDKDVDAVRIFINVKVATDDLKIQTAIFAAIEPDDSAVGRTYFDLFLGDKSMVEELERQPSEIRNALIAIARYEGVDTNFEL